MTGESHQGASRSERCGLCRDQGFTLIELAITVVIIAIVAGGILLGRDLIRGSERRAQVAQIESYESAVLTFTTRFNCLPGDCADAESLDLGENGNGNGRIGDLQGGYFTETINFWRHLAGARLIGDAISDEIYPVAPILGVHTPTLKMPGMGQVPDAFAQPAGGISLAAALTTWRLGELGEPIEITHGWALASYIGTGGGFGDRWIGIYPAADVHAIDSKIDNGLPHSGRMRGISTFRWTGGAHRPYYSNELTNCFAFDDAQWVYAVDLPPVDDYSLCGLVVKAPF